MSQTCSFAMITFIIFSLTGWISCEYLEKSNTLINTFIKPFSLILSENLIEMAKNAILNETSSMNNISKQCSDDMMYFFARLNESWAIEMMDSMGKLPAGLLTANMYWLGKYAQCLDVIAPNESTNGLKFNGEYCIFSFTFPNDYDKLAEIFRSFTIKKPALNIALCSPSTCTQDDKINFLKNIFIINGENIDVSLLKDSCQKKGKYIMDTTTMILIAVIALLSVPVLLATTLDLWKLNKGMTFISSFSAIKSLRTIFKYNEAKSSLSCIHGLRFGSMLLVVAGHVIMNTVRNYPWKNQLEVLNGYENFIFQPFMFGSTYADTIFFLISSFLVTYITMQKIQASNGHLNLFGYYVYRYLRLTPAFATSIMFLSGPIHYLNDGPIWPQIKEEIDLCRNYWWRSILYINTFWNEQFICYLPSWYLSVDTQLYVLAPFIVLKFYRNPKLGFLILGTVFLMSTIVTTYEIIRYDHETLRGKISNSQKIADYIQNVFLTARYHVSTYVIGITAGCTLHILENRNITMTKKMTVPIWIFTLFTSILIFYGTYPYISGAYIMPLWLKALYGSLARPALGLCVAWIIVACARGHGGLINEVLSCNFFVPMSRLTYCAFLVNYSVTKFYFLSQHDSLYFSKYNMFMVIIGNAVVTLLAAIVLAVLIEIPTINLLKYLYTNISAKTKVQQLTTNFQDDANFRKVERKLQITVVKED